MEPSSSSAQLLLELRNQLATQFRSTAALDSEISRLRDTNERLTKENAEKEGEIRALRKRNDELERADSEEVRKLRSRLDRLQYELAVKGQSEADAEKVKELQKSLERREMELRVCQDDSKQKENRWRTENDSLRGELREVEDMLRKKDDALKHQMEEALRTISMLGNEKVAMTKTHTERVFALEEEVRKLKSIPKETIQVVFNITPPPPPAAPAAIPTKQNVLYQSESEEKLRKRVTEQENLILVLMEEITHIKQELQQPQPQPQPQPLQKNAMPTPSQKQPVMQQTPQIQQRGRSSSATRTRPLSAVPSTPSSSSSRSSSALSSSMTAVNSTTPAIIQQQPQQHVSSPSSPQQRRRSNSSSKSAYMMMLNASSVSASASASFHSPALLSQSSLNIPSTDQQLTAEVRALRIQVRDYKETISELTKKLKMTDQKLAEVMDFGRRMEQEMRVQSVRASNAERKCRERETLIEELHIVAERCESSVNEMMNLRVDVASKQLMIQELEQECGVLRAQALSGTEMAAEAARGRVLVEEQFRSELSQMEEVARQQLEDMDRKCRAIVESLESKIRALESFVKTVATDVLNVTLPLPLNGNGNDGDGFFLEEKTVKILMEGIKKKMSVVAERNSSYNQNSAIISREEYDALKKELQDKEASLKAILKQSLDHRMESKRLKGILDAAGVPAVNQNNSNNSSQSAAAAVPNSIAAVSEPSFASFNSVSSSTPHVLSQPSPSPMHSSSSPSSSSYALFPVQARAHEQPLGRSRSMEEYLAEDEDEDDEIGTPLSGNSSFVESAAHGGNHSDNSGLRKNRADREETLSPTTPPSRSSLGSRSKLPSKQTPGKQLPNNRIENRNSSFNSSAYSDQSWDTDTDSDV